MHRGQAHWVVCWRCDSFLPIVLLLAAAAADDDDDDLASCELVCCISLRNLPLWRDAFVATIAGASGIGPRAL